MCLRCTGSWGYHDDCGVSGTCSVPGAAWCSKSVGTREWISVTIDPVESAGHASPSHPHSPSRFPFPTPTLTPIPTPIPTPAPAVHGGAAGLEMGPAVCSSL